MDPNEPSCDIRIRVLSHAKMSVSKISSEESYSSLDKTRQGLAYPDSPGSITLKQQSVFGGPPPHPHPCLLWPGFPISRSKQAHRAGVNELMYLTMQ